MALPFFTKIMTQCMIAALKYHISKPQNLHDSETQSAIDPINPLVYIQARNLQFKTGTGRNEIIPYIVLKG